MKTNTILIFLLSVAIYTSCTSSVSGKLVDARDYFNLGAEGEYDHQFAVFSALKGNLPSGIITQNDEFYYLAIPSTELSQYSTKTLKVRGEKNKTGKIILPKRIWVMTEDGWQEIEMK